MAFALFVLVLSCALSPISSSNDTCRWTSDVDGNAIDFDLSELYASQIPISCLSSSGKWFMFYTPCRNELGCDNAYNNNSNTSQYMVTHSSLVTGNCHLYLAIWEGQHKHLPQRRVNEHGKTMYTFNYENGWKGSTSGDNDGECINGRHLNITYICDDDPAARDIAYDPDTIKCMKYSGQSANGICFYTVNITSHLACDAASSGAGSSGLDGAAVFFLVVLIAFSLYCVVGYAYNARKGGDCADYMNNTPNAGLWCYCCRRSKMHSSAGLVHDEFEED